MSIIELPKTRHLDWKFPRKLASQYRGDWRTLNELFEKAGDPERYGPVIPRITIGDVHGYGKSGFTLYSQWDREKQLYVDVAHRDNAGKHIVVGPPEGRLIPNDDYLRILDVCGYCQRVLHEQRL